MSERDNAHGHKTHRSFIVDHPYERHIKPILDHELSVKEQERKILLCHLDNTWARFPRWRNVYHVENS